MKQILRESIRIDRSIFRSVANIKWDSQKVRKKGRKEPQNHLQQKEEDLQYPLENQEVLDIIPSQRKENQDKVVTLASETKALDKEVSLFNETKARKEEVSLFSGTKIRDKVASHANRIERRLNQGAFLAFQEKQKRLKQPPIPLNEIKVQPKRNLLLKYVKKLPHFAG